MMVEHYTKGIVLDRKARGELDGTVTIYTEALGKVPAFVKSIYRPTSKLSGHLVPGKFVNVRIVEKNNIQAVDALSRKISCEPRELLRFISFINELVPYEERDPAFWEATVDSILSCDFKPARYKSLLAMLGFGTESAVCDNCGDYQIEYFSAPDIMFLCRKCAEKAGLSSNGIIQIG